jgi:hypothetical protein
MTMRDQIAALLWRTEAVDSGTPQSVIDRRTPEAFADQSPELRGKWFKYADAILAALPGMIPDLVWEWMEIKQNCAPGLWEQCYTPLGLYEIHTFTGKGGTFYLKTPDYGRASEHEYHTAARDTANAHNRAAIAQAVGWTND